MIARIPTPAAPAAPYLAFLDALRMGDTHAGVLSPDMLRPVCGRPHSVLSMKNTMDPALAGTVISNTV